MDNQKNKAAKEETPKGEKLQLNDNEAAQVTGGKAKTGYYPRKKKDK